MSASASWSKPARSVSANPDTIPSAPDAGRAVPSAPPVATAVRNMRIRPPSLGTPGTARPAFPRLDDLGYTPCHRRLPRREVTALAVCTLLATLGALVLFCFDPRQYHFYPLCFFHQTTGLLCPGCGALRGFHQLLHGHPAAAFRFNPMLVASMPFVLWFGASYGLRAARNQPWSLALRPVWLWIILTAVLVVSVLRNVPGSTFALLRP